MTETTFDDRLLGHDSVDSLMNAAEEIARELAAENAPDNVCGACIRSTPLAKDAARDVPKAAKVEELYAEVRGRVARYPGESDEPYWVENEITREYTEHYRGEAAASPAGCGVCTGTLVDPSEPCGHERAGEECPAR